MTPNDADSCGGNLQFVDMPAVFFATQFRTEAPVTEWPDEFAVITACATTGEIRDPERERTADRALEQELRSTAARVVRLTGFCPDSGHAEPGWAAAVTFSDACDLGIRYRQLAIYYVRGDQLFVSFCDERRELIPVGTFRSRLSAGGQEFSASATFVR